MKLLIPLFSPATGTWGGMTRVMAITQAAQQAGHQVAFCAAGQLGTDLRERGFKVYPTPPATFFGLPRPISHIMEKRSQRITLPVRQGKSIGNIWMVLMLSGMTQGTYLKRLVAAEQQAAQDFRADTLFTDLDPGAILLARLTGLPIAAAFQSVMKQGIGSMPWQWMNQGARAVLKEYHLPDEPFDALWFGPQVLKIIPSIPELEREKPAPDVRYVGSLLGEINPSKAKEFEPERGKRYLFVYTGTGSVSLNTVRQVLTNLLPETGRVRAIIGAQSITQTIRQGAVELRPYISAEALLPYCDWTICHGGQNTIIQSLTHGVPLAIFPGPIFERRFNAMKIQEAGAGRMGELNEFNPQWLQDVFSQQETYAHESAKLGERIQLFGGAAAAVKAIENWRGMRKPS